MIMKNIVKSDHSDVGIHVYEFMFEFMPAWIHFNEIIYKFILMNSYVNSVLWRISWIMAEFLEMNSHMKSWLNSLILKYSWFSFKFVSVKEIVLLVQSNHHPSFAVSSLQALRLLRGCCSVATRRHCCDGRRRVLRTAGQGGRGGPCKHMMDVTGVEIGWACLSARFPLLQERKL